MVEMILKEAGEKHAAENAAKQEVEGGGEKEGPFEGAPPSA